MNNILNAIQSIYRLISQLFDGTTSWIGGILTDIKESAQIMDDWDRNDSAKVQGSIEHDSPDTQYPVMIGGRAATSKPSAVANNDVVRAYFDQYGRLHIYDEGGGGVGGGGFMTYILDSTNSLGHGKVEYTLATQITASAYSFTINPRLIIKIERFNSGGTYQETITPTSHLITEAGGVFTITGMNASATDLFVLYIQGQERTVDAFQNAQNIKNQNPDWAHRENQTENITPTVAVQYFAIPMDTYKHASIGICVSGTVTSTLKCYAINDASVTIPTSGAIPAGWTDVSTDILGAASVAIANVSPATTCSKFFIDTAISVEYLLLQFDTSAASSTPLIVPRVLKFY